MARTNFANGVPNDVQAADLNQMGSEINANTAAIASSGGGVAVQTHAAAAKTTPADADEFPQADSAASFGLKRLTWANLKAAVRAYYDSVATTLTNKTISGASNTLSGIGVGSLSATGTPSSTTYLRGDNSWGTPAGGGGGDASTNTSTSVDSEVAVFSGTAGKTIKRSTGTGVAQLSSGVLSATTSPTIGSFANSAHNHANAAGGGQLTPSTALGATGTPSSSTFLRGDNTWSTPSGGGDTSTNTATSVDSEAVVFSGTSGKTLKRATGSGVAKLTSGVLSAGTVAIAEGGTGATTAPTARTALGSTTVGDAVFVAANAAAARTAIGAAPILQVFSATSSATPTPDVSTYDESHWTALAAAATFGAPTGTPYDGQPHVIRVKDNGTARTLGYNAIYRAMGITLPTTTVVSKNLYLALKYNSTDTKWDVLDFRQEA